MSVTMIEAAFAAPLCGISIRWPPAVAGLAPEHVRCRECWVATGRKRPRSRIVTEEKR